MHQQSWFYLALSLTEFGIFLRSGVLGKLVPEVTFLLHVSGATKCGSLEFQQLHTLLLQLEFREYLAVFLRSLSDAQDRLLKTAEGLTLILTLDYLS